MAKAPAEEKGGKEKKDEKKKGGDDEMIEKPREPMFSKNGLILLIGSNLLIVILVSVGVMMMGGEDPAPEKKDEMGSGGKFNSGEDAWLELESLTTPVPMPGGRSSTVRYALLIRFEGGPTEQAEIIGRWEQGNNKKILRAFADDTMKKYDLERVRDESFKRVYADELKKVINVNITPDKVKMVVVTEMRHD